MNRVEILNTAAELISGDRAATYGDALVSHQRIANLWSTYLGAPVSAVDVAACLILMKVSRSKGAAHRDNWIDMAGYAALAGEMEAATTAATTAARTTNGSRVDALTATKAATIRFDVDED